MVKVLVADLQSKYINCIYISAHCLPDLCDYNAHLPPLSDHILSQLPVKNRLVPFSLPIGDGACANIGSKCFDASRVALTVGTSAALRIVVEADKVKNVKIPKVQFESR
jgi:sugar (pentulose or hexulose) kinase